MPWLLFFIYHGLAEPEKDHFVPVLSKGLVCSVGMLFIMLFVLVFAIAVSHWRMHRFFGVIMMLSYGVFCVISVMLETDKIACPLRFSACAEILAAFKQSKS